MDYDEEEEVTVEDEEPQKKDEDKNIAGKKKRKRVESAADDGSETDDEEDEEGPIEIYDDNEGPIYWETNVGGRCAIASINMAAHFFALPNYKLSEQSIKNVIKEIANDMYTDYKKHNYLSEALKKSLEDDYLLPFPLTGKEPAEDIKNSMKMYLEDRLIRHNQGNQFEMEWQLIKLALQGTANHALDVALLDDKFSYTLPEPQYIDYKKGALLIWIQWNEPPDKTLVGHMCAIVNGGYLDPNYNWGALFSRMILYNLMSDHDFYDALVATEKAFEQGHITHIPGKQPVPTKFEKEALHKAIAYFKIRENSFHFRCVARVVKVVDTFDTGKYITAEDKITKEESCAIWKNYMETPRTVNDYTYKPADLYSPESVKQLITTGYGADGAHPLNTSDQIRANLRKQGITSTEPSAADSQLATDKALQAKRAIQEQQQERDAMSPEELEQDIEDRTNEKNAEIQRKYDQDRHDQQDKKFGLVPGTTKGFNQFADGAVKAATTLVDTVSDVLPPAMKNLYQAFAPPGSIYHTEGTLKDKAINFGLNKIGAGRRRRIHIVRGGMNEELEESEILHGSGKLSTGSQGTVYDKSEPIGFDIPPDVDWKDGHVAKIFHGKEAAEKEWDIAQHLTPKNLPGVVAPISRHTLPNGKVVLISKHAGQPLDKLDLVKHGHKVGPAMAELQTHVGTLNKNGVYHNDLHLGNIMYDGNKLNMVDWGNATVGHTGGDSDIKKLNESKQLLHRMTEASTRISQGLPWLEEDKRLRTLHAAPEPKSSFGVPLQGSGSALLPGGSTRQWRKVRTAVLERDGGRCAYCGMHAGTVDHIKPRHAGGTDDMNNLCACCQTCNEKKGDHLLK